MSYKYRDTEGFEWDLKITLATARRIEASNYNSVTKAEFSFLQPDQQLFAEVFGNLQFAIALAWTIVQPQVPIHYKLSPEEWASASEELQSELELRFVSAMDGDVLNNAKRALMESLADFFPEQRTVLLTIQNKIAKASKLLDLQLKNVGPELDKMIEREIKQGTSDALDAMRGVSSTKPWVSSDSTKEILQA